MSANDVVLTAYGQQKPNHYLIIDPNGGIWDGKKDVFEWLMPEEDSMELAYPELEGREICLSRMRCVILWICLIIAASVRGNTSMIQ